MGRIILFLFCLVLFSPATVVADQSLSLEVGNWTAGLEYETPWGPFVEVHSPYGIAALHSTSSGVDWTLPLGARLGWAFHLGDAWSIRTALRTDLLFWYGNTCMNPEGDHLRSLLLAEVGFRWQHTSGFRVGVDLTPLGFSSEDGCDDSGEFVWWEWAFLMCLVTVGWNWSL